MQAEAADEMRMLQFDLDIAFGDVEPYRTDTGGATVVSGGGHFEKLDDVRLQASDKAISGQGVGLPPISPPQKDEIMAEGSPEGEIFCPTLSPSPPVTASALRNTAPDAIIADSPRSIDARMQSSSLPAAMPQPMSHSLPSRLLDDWNDGRLRSAAASGANTPGGTIMSHLSKRRRPEYGSGSTTLQSSGMPNNSTTAPYPHVKSPRTAVNRIHGPHYSQNQRITRSPPRMSCSPKIPSTNAGQPNSTNKSTHTPILPSIAQFTLSPIMTSPMHVGSPNIGRGPGQHHYMHPNQHQQQQHIHPYPHPHPHIGNAPGRDVYTAGTFSDGGTRRFSDSATGDNSSGSGRVEMVTGRDEYGHGEIDQLNTLREENAHLRQRLMRLEASVAQKHSDVVSWMRWVEDQFVRKDSSNQ
ncbi:hypothetical protein LPJ81_002554 [Coemansia sp. IMI 209127]|nr:hypothetical protein LPJ81_002554 [Coemansia sp. IMI 209127]